ncbi:hypothetical protein CEXT_94161 [Caerostris extrusa]|uniref:Uncharacterized protein n=1 Tax=Caerostris extrusa TaxID=172846 RepID=A0AAV4VUR0_CAEEX|nr:hypothetical protein CEXT_94161 [Caerostris extrusa]
MDPYNVVLPDSSNLAPGARRQPFRLQAPCRGPTTIEYAGSDLVSTKTRHNPCWPLVHGLFYARSRKY